MFEALRGQVQSLTSQLREAKSVIAETTAAAQEAASTVSKAQAQVSAAVTAFDGVTAQFIASQNVWAQELEKGIDALKAGALSREEFLRQYGDFNAIVDGQNTTLQAALNKVDFGAFSGKVQELIGDLARSQVSVEEIIARVSELGGQFAEGTARMIEQWRRGELSFEQLAAQIKRLQEQFPGSDFAALLDGVGDELQQQEKDGFL